MARRPHAVPRWLDVLIWVCSARAVRLSCLGRLASAVKACLSISSNAFLSARTTTIKENPSFG